MIARALAVALVLSQAADELVTMRLATVRIRVPAAWNHRVVEQGTHRFDAPSGEAYFLLDTGKTATRMDAAICVGKITQNLGGDWTRVSIGASPAAKRLEIIHNDQTHSDVHEYTYVGCDGVSTWSLIYRVDARKKERFAPLGDKVAGSVDYVRTP
jgi:hypothetical protein